MVNLIRQSVASASSRERLLQLLLLRDTEPAERGAAANQPLSGTVPKPGLGEVGEKNKQQEDDCWFSVRKEWLLLMHPVLCDLSASFNVSWLFAAPKKS